MNRTRGFAALLSACLALALWSSPSPLLRAAARTSGTPRPAGVSACAGAMPPMDAAASARAAAPACTAAPIRAAESARATASARAAVSAITACRPAAAPASTERRPAAARFAAPLRDTRGCKPRAPIELTLLQTGARDGSVVELLVDVRPHASAGALRWELLLPEGTQVLAGDLRGELAAGAAGTGPMAVHLRLPTTAEFPGVSLLAEARLVEPAAGAALTSPEERVAARQSLRWGLPPAAAPPADPARRLVDVARAAGARIAEVPAAHRSGR